jgi:hypothetical protein
LLYIIWSLLFLFVLFVIPKPLPTEEDL